MGIGFFNPLLSFSNTEGVKNFFWFLGSLLCLFFCSHGFSESIPEAINRQNPSRLFHEGRIEAAARVAFEASLRDPQDWKSFKILGWVALMKNQLEDARRFLQKGLALNPEDTEMKRLLAICYYREGKLEQSADLLNEIREGWTVNLLTQLEPKAFDMLEPQTTVKLDESYPFVIIPVKIYRKKVSLFLDTRSSFTALDRALYEKIKEIRLLDIIALQFWFNFAGKWSIRARTGIIQSMQIGNMKIERIPILLARWKGTYLFPQHVPQIVHGVIGTDVMRQFNVTIDYPKKELFLQKREASFSERSFLEAKDGSVTKLPFYLTPGGQILIQGKINDQEGILFMVDSLDVGRAFTFSEWMLEKFHLPRYGGWMIGLRRGGRYPSIYTIVPKIQIGNMVMENVKADIGKSYDFPPAIDHKQGFHIGAIVGNSFLKSFIVTFDFQNMVLILQSKKTAATDQPPTSPLAYQSTLAGIDESDN